MIDQRGKEEVTKEEEVVIVSRRLGWLIGVLFYYYIRATKTKLKVSYELNGIEPKESVVRWFW